MSLHMKYLARHPGVTEVVGIDGIAKAMVSMAHCIGFEIARKTLYFSSILLSFQMIRVWRFELYMQEEFSEENPSLNLKSISQNVDMDQWTGEGISLLRGDYFALDDTKAGGKFDDVFDRASMVAIDPSKRHEYDNIMGQLIQPGGNILFVRRIPLHVVRRMFGNYTRAWIG
mmetsp:Transcript_12362/g.35345  ORF Transcript_12362/g.35345 Transcript_12362/m.35345 type:complete len:172 (-) Transcript_12362:905-1420(-)